MFSTQGCCVEEEGKKSISDDNINKCSFCNCDFVQVIDVYSHIFEVGPDFRHPPKLGSYFNVSKSTVQVVLIVILHLL